ncbi:MAG: hypothetical protein M1829_004289 [Trizodia sp. TS-e1964]|nr:MAG: hypothetical protein M1829_004289 [Trizodia sp. TS-e1964]
MSLNGLDGENVTEAYEAALAEPGGWLLLHYVSRDEIALLGRGTNGVVEIRDAVDRSEGSAPLYGFIRYRRRNVIIKYIPEGTSRLVQARVTVHFQSITERFTPYDTVFAISASKELRDTSLSAACSLHTASGSTSSSTSSLRKRQLVEIAEDTEDDQNIGNAPDKAEPDIALSSKEAADTPLIGLPDDKIMASKPSPQEPALRPAKSDLEWKSPSTLESPFSNPTHESEDRRTSSNSLRPTPADLYGAYSFQIKPKVKLGPRPSLDAGGRPHTTGSMFRQDGSRPVSSLPASIRATARRPNAPKPPEPKSTSSTFLALPYLPMPEIPKSPVSPVRPTSSRSTRSTNSPSFFRMNSANSKSVSMTPEKQRLMKALQLRKQQIAINANKPADIVIQSTILEVEPPLAAEAPSHLTIHTAKAEPDSLNDPDKADSGVSMGQSPTTCEEVPVLKHDSSPESAADSASATTRASSLSNGDKDIFPSKSIISLDTTKPTVLGIIEPKLGLITAAELSKITPANAVEIPPNNSTTLLLESEIATSFSGFAPESFAIKAEISSQDELLLVQNIASPQERQEEAPISSETPLSSGAPLSENTEDSPPSEAANDKVEQNLLADKGPVFQEHALLDQETLKTPVPSPLIQTPTKPQELTLITQNIEVSPEPATLSKDRLSIQAKPGEDQKTPKQVEVKPYFKRHVITKSLETDLSLEDYDDNMLSDDSLMDELNTATVHEAKPITVTKSPITSLFPRNAINRRMNRFMETPRSVSTPVRQGAKVSEFQTIEREIPGMETARSVSVSSYNLPKTPQGATAMATKVNVSSGISQRIKALELLSSQTATPGAPSPPQTAGSDSSAQSTSRNFGLRGAGSKPVVNKFSHTPAKGSASSLSNAPMDPYTPRSTLASSTPNETRAREDSNETSVSITARIVRSPGHYNLLKSDFNPNSVDSSPNQLDNSPLATENQNIMSLPPRSKTYSQSKERPSSVLSVDRASSSELSPTASNRSQNIADQSSMSSRSKGSIRISTSDSTGSTSGYTDDSKQAKKESKKSRILRRMSNISSSSRKSIAQAISPTVREEETKTQTGTGSQNMTGIEVGEVNVQFPDNLLWKRRKLTLDSQGFIVLSKSKVDENSKVLAKRYHLSEFRTPYSPDQDSQELPYSVILDFNDGGALQCACENPTGQSHVLNVLRESYNNWIS